MAEAENFQLPQAPKISFTQDGESPDLNLVDLDGDGKTDIWRYNVEDGEASYQKGMDLNKDGREDLRSYYSSNDVLLREEIDADFDGKVDIHDRYENGERAACEIDTNADGIYDLFYFYEQNTLVRQEQDTDYNGSLDLCNKLDMYGNVTESCSQSPLPPLMEEE